MSKETKTYQPDKLFIKDGNFIYLLQRNSGRSQQGCSPVCNDITISIQQSPAPRGLNKMPKDQLTALSTCIHEAANKFLRDNFEVN